MTLAQLVDAMRAAASATNDPATIVARLREPVLAFAASDACRDPRLGHADPAIGFGLHTLHVEPDESMEVVVASMLPGRTLPPHDHGTWAIAAGIASVETNVFWRRVDDRSRADYAELVELRRERYGPGSFLGFGPADIHSVINETRETSISLNLYGIALGHAGAMVYDPMRHTMHRLEPPPDTR